MLVLNEFRKIYDQDFSRIERVGSQYIVKSEGKDYHLKRTKNEKLDSVFKYLLANGFYNVLEPLKTSNNKQYLIEIDNHAYYMTRMREDIEYPQERKLTDFLGTINSLHTTTAIKKRGNKRDYIDFYDYQRYQLNNIFKLLDLYVTECEGKSIKTPIEWTFLMNYKYIIETKKLLLEIEKYLDEAYKKKETIPLTIIHTKPYLEHMIITNESKYLVSIDNCKLGCPTIDFVKIFATYLFINIDWIEELNKYLVDEFERYFFIFNTLFLYYSSFKISEIVSAQLGFGVNRISYFFEGLRKMLFVFHHLIGNSGDNDDQD